MADLRVLGASDGRILGVLDTEARRRPHPVDPMSRQHRPKTSCTGDHVDRSRASRLEKQRAEILRLVALRNINRRLARIEEHVHRRDDSSAALPEASSITAERSDPLFHGVIQGDLLADMLQLVSVNAMSGVLEVVNGAGSIDLYCEGGRILHAAGLGLSGDNAVHAVFAFDEGSYSFRRTTRLPKERTVTKSTQLLILEALREVDGTHAE